MRDWVRQGQSLLGVAALCSGMVGCAAHRDDSLRLSEELGRARAEAAWQEARAAQLEARMLRLEQRTVTSQLARPAEDRELLTRLDRLLELNQRLLAEHAAPAPPVDSAAQQGGKLPAPLPPAAASPASAEALTLSQEQELRALVVRMRGHRGSPHGGLTREQENALRVLTRPERTLDRENPWPTAFY